MNNRELCQKYNCIYWQDFLNGRRGTPYPLLPTVEMSTTYEIYGLTRTDTKTGEKIPYEVLFDREYIEYWIRGNQVLIRAVGVISFNKDAESTEKPLNLLDLFAEFEESVKITLSSKNPRQSIYLKFKEYVKCQQQ